MKGSFILIGLLLMIYVKPSKQQNVKAWINEFHYDNTGNDVGEFVEIGHTGGAVTNFRVVLYSGSGGGVYSDIEITSSTVNPCGISYTVLDYPSDGIQNGATSDTGNVVDFVSYEGSFTALNGQAFGQTSVDIQQREVGSTEIGFSLQKCPDVTDVWNRPTKSTKGVANTGCVSAQVGGILERSQALAPASPQKVTAWINEFHYDNTGNDVGEFVEIGHTGGAVTNFRVVLYSGSGGGVYSDIEITSSRFFPECETSYTVLDYPSDGIQNGANTDTGIDPEGIALVDPDGNVVDFVSYEGSFTALNGQAFGLTSVDIGKRETGNTAVGFSLQKCPNVPNTWTNPLKSTKGVANPDCAIDAPSKISGSPSNSPTEAPSESPTSSPSDSPVKRDCTITFHLFNSVTNAFAAALTNGVTITNPPPCGKTNIEAIVPCVASNHQIVLELWRGAKRVKRRTESNIPYFLFGNNGANVLDGKIAAGRYGIRAIVDGVTSPFTNFTLGGTCS